MFVEMPAMRAGDSIDVSATTYVTYLQCPERAAARLRGEYGPDSIPAFKGGLSHRIFARHLRDGEIPAEEFTQACREEIGASMNPKMASLGIRPGELRSIIEEAGSLYERFKSLQFDGFAGAEVAVEAEPAEGVRLLGKVDAIFDDPDYGVRLVDWKTGQIDPSTDDQLAFYSLLWAMDRDELPGVVEAISVKTGQRSEAVPTRADAELTAVRIAELVNAVRDAWASGAELPRHGGPWCRYCPLLDDCHEGRTAQKVLSSRG